MWEHCYPTLTPRSHRDLFFVLSHARMEVPASMEAKVDEAAEDPEVRPLDVHTLLAGGLYE